MATRIALDEAAEETWALVSLDVHHDTGEVIRYREVNA
jgi:hypothetical protein